MKNDHPLQNWGCAHSSLSGTQLSARYRFKCGGLPPARFRFHAEMWFPCLSILLPKNKTEILFDCICFVTVFLVAKVSSDPSAVSTGHKATFFVTCVHMCVTASRPSHSNFSILKNSDIMPTPSNRIHSGFHTHTHVMMTPHNRASRRLVTARDLSLRPLIHIPQTRNSTDSCFD